MKIISSPDGKTLFVNTAGWHDHSVNAIDVASEKIAQSANVGKNWTGMAFNPAAKSLVVSSGGPVSQQFADLAKTRGVPADHRRDGNPDHRARRRPRPSQDLIRHNRHTSARDAQQLRRRPHSVEYHPHLRRELQPVLRQPQLAGQGALATWTQAAICINTRQAADAIGATRMDRPEDIETNPVNGKVYCVFTNNTQIGTFRKNDGIYVVPTEGSERGYLRQLLSGVPGGEVASLALGLNDRYLFASIQHPAEGSTLASLTSTFPDGGMPRPTVVVVENTGGSHVIGN